MKIMFSGGGTAGSVTPLLALAEQLKQHELFFVGTKHGVERQLVTRMTYIPLLAGKWRRYFSIRNVLDLGVIVGAFFQAWYYVLKYAPDVVVSAGGFVSVPLVWAAWWCNIPIVVHHQDVCMSLATRLMKPFASVITYAIEIGNPVRTLTVTTDDFKLDPTVPTLLIMGGGTGAQAINDLVSPELTEFCNVIHITGPGKSSPPKADPPLAEASSALLQRPQRFKVFELLTDSFAEALHKADLIVCRAGFGTISELAAMGKASILIPIPHSHQEDNAQLLAQQQAAVVLNQNQLTPAQLTAAIKETLHQRTSLQTKIKTIFPANATITLCQLIERLGNSSR